MKSISRKIALAIARFVGIEVIDITTGERLGRALFVPWRGKIHVIGLNGAVRATFLPQPRVTYWKQEIGFCKHEPADFPSLASDPKQENTN